ncbi:MAG: PQQ-binding-like beta-propeller repeat protein [Gemmataceae bacterium]
MTLLLAVLALTPAADWPQFLGPSRDGVSIEVGLNLDWQAHPPKVLWKVPLGRGFSSVAAVGGRLYTMAERDTRSVAVAFDAATGRELWVRDLAAGYVDLEVNAVGPRATPTVVDGHLYCLLPRGELFNLRADDGTVVWQVNALAAVGGSDLHKAEAYFWGLAGSPLVEAGRVIVQPGHRDGGSVAAFDAATGKLAWKAGDDPPGYCPPIVATLAGRRMLVCGTGVSFLGLDPATGAVLWRHPFGSKINCNCAIPLVVDGKLFVSSAYRVGCALIEVLPAGDGFTTREVWKNREMQNHYATSMVHRGYAYGSHGDKQERLASFRCIEVATGKLQWEEPKLRKCSPILAAGHLIVLGERGTLWLVEANPSRYVEKGELPGVLAHKAWAPPALSDGRLYLRDETHLACVDLRKP